MKSTHPPQNLRRGDVVRVRDRQEILASLDARGQIDGLPFMPEMLRYCGQTFRVQASGHKTCDTIHKTGGRRMEDAVHLEGLRCDGSAHGGCEARCLLYFKNHWLEKVSEADRTTQSPPDSTPVSTDPVLEASTRQPSNESAGADAEIRYVCQTTELFRATSPLPWWNARQYVEDVCSRNVSLGDLLNRLYFRFTANAMQHLRGYRFWHALYDRVQKVLGNPPYPIIEGRLKKTPAETLGLQPGDVVRVKPLAAIVETLDVRNRNRGMAFDKEQAIFCGQQHVVERRVTQIIDEPTGRLVKLPNDCIILKGVACTAVYSEKRIACPRAIHSYWRECWLERVEPSGPSASSSTR